MNNTSVEASSRGRIMVRKRTLISITLVFFLSVPALISAELTSVFSFLTVLSLLIFSGLRIPKGLVYLVIPIILLTMIGLLGLLYGNSLYNIFKDCWYLWKSAFALIVGYLLMYHARDLNTLFKLLILAAVISAFAHLFTIVLNPSLMQESIKEIRSVAGRGYIVTTIALPLLTHILVRRTRTLEPRRWLILAALICTMSLTLSFSRTLWISFFVLFVAVHGFISLRNLKRLALFAAGMIILLVYVFSAPPSEQSGPDATFRGKLAYSSKELVIRNYSDMKSINLNWRGYESYRALRTYTDGNVAQYVVGKGFGTLVDLGLYMKLGGEEELRFIPTLHNGYMYVLVKTGMAGLSLYLSLLVGLIVYGARYSGRGDPELELAGRVLAGLSVVVLLTTVVTAGFFDKSVMLPAIVVIGALVAFIRSRDQGAGTRSKAL